jgi:ABC-type transport system substrate-binding protein
VRNLGGEHTCGRGAWRIPAGTPFEVRIQVSAGDALREQIVRQFQDDMRALGIRVSIDLLPGPSRYPNSPARASTFEIRQAAWTSGLDPAGWLGGGGVNILRTPEGETINAYDLWQQRGDTLGADGLTYEQLAFGVPVERREDAPPGALTFPADRLPEGYASVQAADGAAGWCNPQAAELWFDSTHAPDAQTRAAAYREFQMIYAQQLPSLPLFQHLAVAVWAPNLCGPDLGPASALTWNVAAWRFTPPGTQCAAR